jgi:hypothetical protein
MKQHLMRGTPTYHSWRAMKARCLNPKDPAYKNYGGRGITVHEPWLDFRVFLADMGARPDGTELDRERNEEGYNPDNCRWVPSVVNGRNRRNTLRAPDGTPLAELAVKHGVHLDTLKWRLRHGVDLSTALTTPANPAQRFQRS